MIPITPAVALREEEIKLHFIRAAGPGGQNANKVASAVQLRFDARRSPSLDAGAKERLAALAGQRMSADGVLVIRAQRHRTREANKKDALRRLVMLVRAALVPPRRRRKTAVPEHVRRRRLENKRRRGQLKAGRRGDLID